MNPVTKAAILLIMLVPAVWAQGDEGQGPPILKHAGETVAPQPDWGEINVLNTYADPAEISSHARPAGWLDRYFDAKETYKEKTGFTWMVEDGLIIQHGDGHTHADNELNLIGLWSAYEKDRSSGSAIAWWQHAQTIGGLTTTQFMDELGVISPPNGGDTYPNQSANRLQLLAWDQYLAGDRVRLMAGKLTTRVTFNLNRYAVSDREDFFTPMIVNNPVVPFTARGGIGLFGQYIRDTWYLSTMVRDADATNDYLDFSSLSSGAWEYFAEVGLTPRIAGLGEGIYRITWHRTDATTSGPTAGSKRSAVSLSFDQDLGEDLGAFLRYASTTTPLRKFQRRAAGGVQILGVGKWTDDRIGIGAWWGQPTDSELRSEYGVEAFWRMQLTKVLEVTPDLQVILDPALAPNENVVLVFGLRFRLVL